MSFVDRVATTHVAESVARRSTTSARCRDRPPPSPQVIGKWHLGHSAQYHPTFRGFDEYVGVPYSIDMGCVDRGNAVNHPPDAPCALDPVPDPLAGPPAVPLYDARFRNCSGRPSCNGAIVEQPADLTSLADRYGDAAVEFIGRHAAGATPPAPPFLLYVPFSHIHVPLAHAPRWTNASRARTLFADTLLELDDAVGRVIAALETHGVANNTLVYLTGDNGPWNAKCELAGSQGPFLGAYQASLGGGATGKFSTWEGGHRVAGIAAWPGAIPAGAVSHATVSTLDLVPTFAALAGVALPTDRQFDGVDLAPILFANATAAARDFLFHPDTRNGNITAVRFRQYKALFESQSFAACAAPGTAKVRHDPPLIFDLDADPGEAAPLAAPPPDVVAAVKAAFAEKWGNITTTYRSAANYTGGGRPAWPCCNSAHVSCRCTD